MKWELFRAPRLLRLTGIATYSAGLLCQFVEQAVVAIDGVIVAAIVKNEKERLVIDFAAKVDVATVLTKKAIGTYSISSSFPLLSESIQCVECHLLC
jgi:hypothetical protein